MVEVDKILVVGASGSGKSSLTKDLPTDTTGIINIEDQPLPHRNIFKHHSRPRTVAAVYEAIVEMNKNPEIECIFIDSLSAFLDMAFSECRASYKGFDIFSNYNIEVSKFLKLIKRLSKVTFLTAHYEILSLDSGQEKRVKTKGKEWEGLLEKEFVIVLYSNMEFQDGVPVYYLNRIQENTSAKCPPDIFEEMKIQNSGKYILNKVKEYRNV